MADPVLYTTTRKVRGRAGLINNPYITDDWILLNLKRAQARVDSVLSGHFTVPFSNPISDTIENITSLLAAGYLLKGEFGQEALGTVADGQAKIDEAELMLTSLQNGTSDIVNSDGSSAGSGSGGSGDISGWPNKSTATTPVRDGGSVRRQRMGQVF